MQRRYVLSWQALQAENSLMSNSIAGTAEISNERKFIPEDYYNFPIDFSLIEPSR